MSLAFILSVLLVLGVVFVNGWTDAPNAIGSAVATRVLRPRSAIIVAVVFNFLGVLLMTFISTQVADTISNMVDLAFRQPTITCSIDCSHVCHRSRAVAHGISAFPPVKAMR